MTEAAQVFSQEASLGRLASAVDTLKDDEKAGMVWSSFQGVAENCSECAPGRTRTCDPRIRNPLLYPAELREREEDFSR